MRRPHLIQDRDRRLRLSYDRREHHAQAPEVLEEGVDLDKDLRLDGNFFNARDGSLLPDGSDPGSRGHRIVVLTIHPIGYSEYVIQRRLRFGVEE